MRSRWELLLWPPFLLSTLVLISTQFVFLRASFFRDLGLGRTEPGFNLANYLRVFQDPFYLQSLQITFYVSALVVLFSILLGYPVAYTLARMRSRWVTLLLTAVVITSFITIVIKVLGLIILFGADGPLNNLLERLGLAEQRLRLLGTVQGVVIGLLHYTIGFTVLVLFSVIQTIPRSLEEAARIHGASRWRVFWRVVIPLSLPGVIGSSLIVFNLSMGAFTSAALLGGGRILTLPVLIQRTIVLETKYGMAATLSAVLLITVLAVNLLSVFLVSRLKVARVGGQ